MFDRAFPWKVLRRLASGNATERTLDPADMGTAFALEFFLAQCEPTPPGGAAETSADELAAGLSPPYRAGL